MQKVIRKIIILLALLGLAGTGGYYGWRSWKNKQQAILEKSAKSPDKLFTVKRGDLPIGVLLPGSINTRVKHKLFLEVPLSTKLVSVVEENEKVSKGDIIARFEKETLQTQIDDLKISIADGEKTLKLAREELAMLISANNADLKSAKDNLDDAISAYSKYRKLDGPKSKNQQDQAVSNAYQSLRDAETAYKTAYDNYYNPTEVAKDENEVSSRKKSYEAALKSLKSARISYRNTILDRVIMIITTALFAFYKLISSFMSIAKDRKHIRPVDSSIRMLELAQAFFAIFSLQASMFHTFGTGQAWEHGMNILTGCAVCLLVVSIGIYMIRRSNREIKKLRESNYGESFL